MPGERPLLSAMCVAGGIGLFSVVLARLVLQSGASRRLASAVPAELKCFVSGLLSGLGLLVMMPLAVEQLTPEWPIEHVMLAFLAAPLAMFFFNHVILDHQHFDDPDMPHAHGRRSDGTQIMCGDASPAKFSFNMAPQALVCQVAGKSPALITPRRSGAFTDKLSVLCGAVPYTVHAAVDGSILGTAHSPVLLASLALPIGLCAVQDVATIILSLSANKASRRDIVLTAMCFGAGFPLGAGLIIALAVAPSADPGFALALPAFAAGLFLYMALFELAPPHADGRTGSLAYWLSFATGVALAYATEAVEQWAENLALLHASNRTDPNVSPDAEPVCAALVLLVLLLALVCFWCRRRVPSAATARRVVSVAVKRVASWPRSRSNHMLAPLGARRSRISSDATLPGRESAFREQL